MIYAKTENGVVIETSLAKFKNENPSANFPQSGYDAFMASYGFARVVEASKPLYDVLKEQASYTIVEAQGTYSQTWTVEALPMNDVSSNMLGMRDMLRHESRAALVDGVPVNAAWAAYFSALGQIDQQQGFPLAITWPTPPQE